MHVLEVKELSISAPQKVLCDKISFNIPAGVKYALVAKNGAGKSTLLRTLAGKQDADDGEIKWLPRVEVGHLEQSGDFDPRATVLDTLFAHDSEQGQVIKAYETALEKGDGEALEALVQQIEELQARDYETQVRIVIDKLNLHDILEQTIEQCSGGELKRLELARLLISDPDVLLLDEPTNHLDVDMIEWLETTLKRSKRTILLVSHDRYFLERVCEKIYELDDGQLYQYPADYDKFLELKDKREQEELQRAHHKKQVLKKELAWMRKAPRARENKSALRTKKFLSVEADYKATKHQIANKHKPIEISSADQRMGGKILNVHNISKSFDEKVLIEDFSYSFRAGERVALVGKNGVGKSTLLNILMKQLEADSGHIIRGQTITMAMYEQKQQSFDETKKVLDVVRDVAEYITVGNGKRVSASQLLDLFGFSPERQRQRAYTLSGGEKRRLHLLTVLIANPNFLILDEPTNDLDIMTMTVLENFLLAYKGCLVIVSHDRFFVDSVVDHLFVFEGEGVINEFPGTYSDRQQQQLTKTAKPDPVVPASPATGELIQQHVKKRTSLTNREREEYQFLGEEMERLETRKEEINLALSKTTEHKEIKVLSKELAQIVEKLQRYEERWLELAERG